MAKLTDVERLELERLATRMMGVLADSETSGVVIIVDEGAWTIDEGPEELVWLVGESEVYEPRGSLRWLVLYIVFVISLVVWLGW